MLLDAQRDLVQGNYELIKSLADSMDSVITSMLVGRNTEDHLRRLDDVRTIAKDVSEKAAVKSPEAFRTANRLRFQCQTCHNSTNPSSGRSWEQIFAMNWDKISARCNEEDRNPFVCKHMYGLASTFSYFQTAIPANHMDFKVAEDNAKEVVRITNVLISQGQAIHDGGIAPLLEVQDKAKELMKLAASHNPEVYQKSLEVSSSCEGCHGGM